MKPRTRHAIVSPAVFLVTVYRKVVSPLLPVSCRYRPTCSRYMIDALRTWGPVRGTWLGVRRILRCHPWGGSGDDPVPSREDGPTSAAPHKS